MASSRDCCLPRPCPLSTIRGACCRQCWWGWAPGCSPGSCVALSADARLTTSAKGGSGRLLSLPSRAMHCPCGLRACYGSATGRSSRWSYGLLDSRRIRQTAGFGVRSSPGSSSSEAGRPGCSEIVDGADRQALRDANQVRALSLGSSCSLAVVAAVTCGEATVRGDGMARCSPPFPVVPRTTWHGSGTNVPKSRRRGR